jgi:amidase
LTEINFDAAVDQARKLDEHYKSTGEVKGPLHGIPISVKVRPLISWNLITRTIHVKGLNTTVGFFAWADRIAEEDSTLVTCRESFLLP